MSFGFLGIQIGFALQNANVSRIFETLGAKVENIPILWIAAPVTGLLVQPIVGYLSDRTWNRLGRRRPYFLIGAILASLALLVDAQLAGALGGGRHALDHGRVHQHLHGAVPRLRGGQPALGAADHRLRDAELPDRHRRRAGLDAALAPDHDSSA